MFKASAFCTTDITFIGHMPDSSGKLREQYENEECWHRGIRLSAFAAFLLLALIGVGVQGWYALSVAQRSVRAEIAMHRAALLECG